MTNYGVIMEDFTCIKSFSLKFLSQSKTFLRQGSFNVAKIQQQPKSNSNHENNVNTVTKIILPNKNSQTTSKSNPKEILDLANRSGEFKKQKARNKMPRVPSIFI